jgi:Family of unknown function (DUF5688)
MRLSKNPHDKFVLEGSGKEFRTIASQLLSTTHQESSYINNPDILEFYQALLMASNKDMSDTVQLITEASVMEWMFQAVNLLSKIKGEAEEVLHDLQYQFSLLQTNTRLKENLSFNDKLFLDYQNILGIRNIKKMIAFLQSFEVTEDELQQMVLISFLESYPAVKLKEIRLDMLERMYHHFFEQYESLLAETHLLYSLPIFKEQIVLLYKNYEALQKHLNNQQYVIGVYLLYFDMVLKGIEDGFVYQAEDNHMLFDWLKPLFNRVALEHMEEFQSEDKEERNQDKEMRLFREVYIQEISKSFPDIERIEDGQDNPYNVVLVLEGKRKVVCNTMKHYQWYVQEEIKGYGKERVRSMKEFIQKIAPSTNSNKTKDLFDGSFEEVKSNIYPMIRLIQSSPTEAIYKPFAEELGVYYGVRLKENGKIQYAIVMKRLLEKWGINLEVLNQTALDNLQREKPTFVTYQDVMKRQLSKEQIQHIPKGYKELYMYAGKSAIDSSYLLDSSSLKNLKKALETDTLILSMPVRDCLLVTKKEHLPLLKELSTTLYENHSAKLSPTVMVEEDGIWKQLK